MIKLFFIVSIRVFTLTFIQEVPGQEIKPCKKTRLICLIQPECKNNKI